MALGLSACAQKSDALIGGSCSLAADQRASLMAPLPVEEPVEITIDDTFTPAQQRDIQRAIETWNAFSQKAFGKKVLTSKVARKASSGPSRSDDCGEMPGDRSHFWIFRESSMSRWTAMGLTRDNPGVSFRCKKEGSRELTRQVVYLNTDIAHPQQLASVALHELGHAFGLDHSCLPGSSQSDYASCEGLKDAHPYRQAVLYPVLQLAFDSKESPERRESLQQNDVDRAFCLYSDGAVGE